MSLQSLSDLRNAIDNHSIKPVRIEATKKGRQWLEDHADVQKTVAGNNERWKELLYRGTRVLLVDIIRVASIPMPSLDIMIEGEKETLCIDLGNNEGYVVSKEFADLTPRNFLSFYGRRLKDRG